MRAVVWYPILVVLLSAAPLIGATVTTVDQVVYDHVGPTVRTTGAFGAPWGAHEGLLHGVPSGWDWAAGARPGSWMNHGSNQAVTSWGQVYEWANGSPVKDVRIQLRHHRMYIYVNGQWSLAEQSSEDIRASWWAENFSGSIGSASPRVEPSSNGGGISVVPKAGYNIHWWTSKWPRPALPSGYQAFFVTCELRIIPNTDANVNLANAKYLAGVSGDSYPTTTSSGSGPWPSLSISRHKFITPQWKTFTSYISDGKPTSVDQYRANILKRPLPPGVTSTTVPVNQAPSVDAGPNRNVVFPASVSLDGTVSDDGPSATLNTTWSVVSGPGAVTFGNARAVDTSATFAVAGSYTLRLTASDGALSANDMVMVTVAPPVGSGTGTILREYWTGIAGTTVASIPLTTTPDGSSQLTSFEGPTHWAELYGARLRGYVIPPVSGSYTFWIAGDDNCELHLGTNDSPLTKRLIAAVPGWTAVREWTKYSQQTSITITLTAGQRYYIEALHKEGNHGDHVAVAWQGPGLTRQVIAGQYLSPFVPIVGVPTPWTSQVIGSASPAGSATGDGDSFSISGSGADIWNASDDFRAVWQSVSGDFDVVTRVTSQTTTHAWAKAGLMVRESTAAGSRHLSVFVTPANGAAMQWRSATGGSSTSIAGPKVVAPTWLKLSRRGTAFSTYQSSNGTSWTLVATRTVAIPSQALVGLAVTSHANGVLSTATFTNVTLLPIAAN